MACSRASRSGSAVVGIANCSTPLSCIALTTSAALRAASNFRISARTRSGDSRDRPSFSAITAARPAAIELTVAVGGAETEESQNAKVVFADTRLRVADEAHATLAQVVEASDRIVESSVLAAVEGIDRKVAPRCVFLPNRREGDDGVSSIGFDIAPQRRHFERNAVGDDGDGAVIDARRMRAEAGLESEAHDLFRHCRRRDIDFVHRAIDEGVANGAADDARFGAFRPRERRRLCRSAAE